MYRVHRTVIPNTEVIRATTSSVRHGTLRPMGPKGSDLLSPPCSPPTNVTEESSCGGVQATARGQVADPAVHKPIQSSFFLARQGGFQSEKGAYKHYQKGQGDYSSGHIYIGPVILELEV